MKPHLHLSLIAVALIGAFSSISRAEDWTTIDGKAYHQVKVIRAEPDAVTILYHDGGALIPLKMLPDDLQKRFHYNPAEARVAAAARAESDLESARALRAEIRQTKQLKELASASYPTTAAANGGAPATSGTDTGISPPGRDYTDANHYSMTDLVDVNQRMRDADLGPDHTKMAALIYNLHSLSPDQSDPSHHSMDDISWGL